MDFQYTINPDRKIFATFLKEIGIQKIMNIMPNIPWDKYRFDDNCSLISSIDEKKDKYVIRKIKAICNYKEDNKPYYFIGGCVYNLHTKSKPDIHHYMDATGDVDVRLNIPKIISIDDKTDIITLSSYFRSVLNKNNKMNELISHYLDWLLLQIHDIFNSTFIDIYDNLQEYKTQHLNINNKVHFLITQEATSIKLQIECKVNGMTEPEHLFECVIVANKDQQTQDTLDMDNRNFNKNCDIYDGIYIQSYDNLVEDNILAITDRTQLVKDKNYQHKLFNHIARLRYLNYIYPQYNNNITDTIKRLLYFLWEENNIKIYNYTKENDKEFMNSMVNNFVSRLQQEPGKNVISIKPKGHKRYKLISNKDIISKYIQSRTRNPFKLTITRRSKPISPSRFRKTKKKTKKNSKN